MKTRIQLIAAILIVGTIRLNAATIPVTNVNDSGPGSLREALISAADGDTIDATGISGTILLTGGELLVNKNVTIIGPGPSHLAVDGNFPNTTNRVFHIGPSTVVNISSLTITNGHVPRFSPGGGGILNTRANLTVSNCTLSGNVSGLYGGGIVNDGSGGSASLHIICSTLAGNEGVLGGGIINFGATGSADAEVVNCTLSDNSAPNGGGGGIFNDGCCGGRARLEVVNSTLSGNRAPSGGGIANGGGNGNSSAEVVNCTLSGNLAVRGAGIDNNCFGVGIAELQVGSTILEDIVFAVSSITNESGTVTSLGYNLSSDDAAGLLSGPGDQSNIDPMLGPLQDNGGPTFTHALLCGSPAIDKGANFTASTTDQRGDAFGRTVDDPDVPNAAGSDGTDIGAFEFQRATCDSDGDGVLDTIDQCPGTLPGAVVDADGCSIAQLVPCVGSWKNHGHYVSAVAHEAGRFLEAGLITEAQQGAIVAEAARSNCGR